MVQAVAVVLSIGLIFRQVKIQASAQIVQMRSEIQARWNQESMLRARLAACSDYLSGQYQFDGASEHVAEFIEELAAYMNSGAISSRNIWEVQSWYIEHYYAMFRDGIQDMRTLL